MDGLRLRLDRQYVSWIYIFVFLLSVRFTDGNEGDTGCDTDWVQVHRTCVKFVKESFKTFGEARQDCQSMGADLFIVSNTKEFNDLKPELKNEITSMDLLNWYIGLQFVGNATDGNWFWVDKEPYIPGLPKWAPAEPNDEVNNRCAVLEYQHRLKDQDCSTPKPYICELVVVTPTPSTSTSTSTTTSSTTTTTTSTTTTPTTTTQMTTTTTASTSTSPTTTTASTSAKPNATISSSVKTTTIASTTQLTTSKGKKTPKPEEIDFTGCYAPNYDSTCPPVEALGISWPETEPGKMARVRCENGEAKWKCAKHPTCWRGEPDIKQCTSEKIQELTEELQKIEEQEEIDADTAIQFTDNLASTIQSETVMSESDIFQSTKLMDAAKKAKPTNSSAAKNIVQNVLKCGNTLVSNEKKDTWKGMKPENKRTIASSLLNSVESVSKEMIKAFKEPTVETIVEENMAMQLQVVDVMTMAPEETVDYAGEDNSFSIPSGNLKASSQGGLARMVFIDYKNIAELLDPDTASEGRRSEIVSKVTSASIGNIPEGEELKEPVTFTFKTKRREGLEEWKQMCSFWDFELGYSGAWSQKGCLLWSFNQTHTTCRCDHLTNFAILLDIHKVDMAEVHATTLSYITYIGIIISIVCLFLSWVTFICLSSVQGERNSIHKHLVFCLFIAEVLFLAGIERTDNEIACAVIAGCLHFFFLASFIWMFIEGVHILFMLVQVFDAAKSRMKYYYMFGYGSPLLAVGVSALVYYEGYGTDKYCWLSTDRWFIWSFAGPVAVVLLVNMIILVYAMASVCKHSEYVFTKGKASNFKGWIQGALALEVLLGLTWIFGYFYLNEQAISMAYLFTIFNSLQGLFIFIFHCLLNKKVRKEYERFIEYKRPTSTMTNSSSKCANGSAGSGSYPVANGRKNSGFLDLSRERNGSTSV